MDVQKFTHLDAGESAFFARELESVKAQVYNVLYPEYTATRLIPVDSSAGAGAETITYRSFDRVGMAKIISNYADDLPRSDVFGKEFTINVKTIGGSFGYNIMEVRNASKAGRPLQQMKATATRQSNEQKVNNLAWFGDPDSGLLGMLSQGHGIPTATAGTAWASATVDEIIDDLNSLINDPIDNTNGVEKPDTILLPFAQFTLISTTQKSTASDTTILEFFLKNQPGVTVEPIPELKAVAPLPSGGAGPSDVAFAYTKRADKLTLEIPSAFEMLPVQERNLEFVVNTMSRIAGVQFYYPLSANILEGI